MQPLGLSQKTVLLLSGESSHTAQTASIVSLIQTIDPDRLVGCGAMDELAVAHINAHVGVLAVAVSVAEGDHIAGLHLAGMYRHPLLLKLCHADIVTEVGAHLS